MLRSGVVVQLRHIMQEQPAIGVWSIVSRRLPSNSAIYKHLLNHHGQHPACAVALCPGHCLRAVSLHPLRPD